MECPRCKNTNRKFFYKLNDRYYCRNCIEFKRIFIDDKTPPKEVVFCCKGYYKLDYNLSDDQMKIANDIVKRYINKQDTVVRAVCGAGKTEIVYEVIQFALKQGHRVCFTTPRTELTKELYQRINEQFFDVSIDLVYGGHHDLLEGQLIVCTTHQLFRFPQSFDLLILDEYDAFPYFNNTVLEAMVYQSVKGNVVYMSATMDADNSLKLTKRYHGFEIPVPTFVLCPFYLSIIFSFIKIKKYIKDGKRTMVFVSSINRAYEVQKLFNIFLVKNEVVHSKVENALFLLDKLKKEEIDIIICTTILERGVTIENAQVIILEGEHKIYDYRTLIQIAGRVGRKGDYPTGDVSIYGVFKTKDIVKCINYIKQDNVSVV